MQRRPSFRLKADDPGKDHIAMKQIGNANGSASKSLMLVPEILVATIQLREPMRIAHVVKTYAFLQVAAMSAPEHCAMLAILDAVNWDRLAQNLLADHRCSLSALEAAA